MYKHSSHILELAKRGAALRLRELANELDILLSAFPDLHDAFDSDELSVSFIVRRDARRAGASAVTRPKPMSAAAKRAVSHEELLGGTSRGTQDVTANLEVRS
jgi:hypothetical protein